MLKEFGEFLKAYGVIGLAIAVIIGGKLNDLVGSLVNDLLMPLVPIERQTPRRVAPWSRKAYRPHRSPLA